MKKKISPLKTFIGILICFSCIPRSHSQNLQQFYIPDSLKKYTYKELFEKEQLFRNDTIKAKIYALTYLHKGKNEQDTIRIANGYSQFGSISSKANMNLALAYSDSIISLTRSMVHFEYPGFGFMVKAMCFYNLGDYEKALDNYLIANNYATKNNNLEQIIYIKIGIGDIKAVWGNDKEVLEIRKSLLKLLETQDVVQGHNYQNLYFNTLLSLSSSFISNKKLDSAMIYARRGIQESLSRIDSTNYYNFVTISGEIAYYQNNFIMALDSLNKAAPHLKNYVGFFETYYYKGNIYWKQQQEAKAYFYFKKTDSIFDVHQDVMPEVRDVQEFFVNYYKQKEDTENQLKYIDRLLYVDSIIDNNRKHLNETITKKYDTPLLLAEKEKIIISLNNEKRNATILNIGLVALVVIAIALLFRSIKRQRIYKERFNKLLSEEKTVKETKRIIHNSVKEISGISKEVVDAVLKALVTFENSNGFTDNRLNLNNLARLLHTNSNYLSKIINYSKGQNFSAYISELRIDLCVDKLKNDQTFRKYTINAIAHDIGFNNAESFSKAFYRRTGIYPSYFIRELEKKHETRLTEAG